MIRNVLLQEAVETKSELDNIAASIKKLMNTCKLTKFKSANTCAKFYSAFFLGSVEDLETPLRVDQWGTIYTTLLSNDAFCSDLASYMLCYQPPVYDGIFMSLWNLIQGELAAMKENRVRYLSMVKALVTMIQTRMQGIGNIIRTQLPDSNAIKFVTVVDQTLGQMVFNLNTMTQAEMAAAVSKDDTSTVVRHYATLSEDVQEVVSLLESADDWIQSRTDSILLSEGIINNAKEAAKSAAVAVAKAKREFNDVIMRKVRKMKEERRNRKHAEMVGDALRLNHEIARLMKTGGLFVISPAISAIYFIISIVYDRATDKEDRAVLVGQLKDELEIIEEKINMAERNGDDKARIELIRSRQKLEREYERIQRMRWDPQTRGRNR